MNPTSRVYIAGHRGLVGSAILRNLQAKGYANFVLGTHAELDLENQAEVGSSCIYPGHAPQSTCRPTSSA